VAVAPEDDPESIVPEHGGVAVPARRLFILVDPDLLLFGLLQEALSHDHGLPHAGGVHFALQLLLLALLHLREVVVEGLVGVLDDEGVAHLH